jgi:hypothetical protein
MQRTGQGPARALVLAATAYCNSRLPTAIPSRQPRFLTTYCNSRLPTAIPSHLLQFLTTYYNSKFLTVIPNY